MRFISLHEKDVVGIGESADRLDQYADYFAHARVDVHYFIGLHDAEYGASNACMVAQHNDAILQAFVFKISSEYDDRNVPVVG